MTDWYGKGRWGTGSRPLQTGPEQSAYDVGAQQRRFEEERRQREQREHYDRQRKQQEEQRRKDRESAKQWANRSNDASNDQQSSGPSVASDDDLEFDDWMLLVAIGGFTFLLIKLWGLATASLAPSNAILAAIVDHGVWGVALLGIGLGIRLQQILLPIAKIALILVVLFFGSAIVFGIYEGITS